jgi:hypothetical protein
MDTGFATGSMLPPRVPKAGMANGWALPRLAARSQRLDELAIALHLHLRALTSARQAGRPSVSRPGGAER